MIFRNQITKFKTKVNMMTCRSFGHDEHELGLLPYQQNNYYHFSVACSNKKGFPSMKRGSSSLTDH